MAQRFETVRRQQFMREKYSVEMRRVYEEAIATFSQSLSNPGNDSNDRRRLSWGVADTRFELFCLRYTAGDAIEPLRDQLEQVVAAYEQFTIAVRAHEGIDRYPAMSFDLLYGYTRCQQLIGLCYLLHRGDLLTRIAALQDPNYQGHDAFYEDFLDFGLPGRPESTMLYHEVPYRHLHDAMYEDTDEESIRDIEIFISKWYKSLRNAPWHDTHMQMSETSGAYFGYWAFEAGAVAYLLNLDDSQIDHMIYPKDLVAWARANEHLQNASADAERGRCEAGQPCPREGYWFTPAQVGRRRFFKVGEVMPEVGGDYGLTIWQWDEASQHPPKL